MIFYPATTLLPPSPFFFQAGDVPPYSPPYACELNMQLAYLRGAYS